MPIPWNTNQPAGITTSGAAGYTGLPRIPIPQAQWTGTSFSTRPSAGVSGYLNRIDSFDPTLLNAWDPSYDPQIATPEFLRGVADRLKTTNPEVDWESLKNSPPQLMGAIQKIVNNYEIDWNAIRSSSQPEREAIRQMRMARQAKGLPEPVSDPTSPWAIDTARVTAASEAYANRQRPEFHVQQPDAGQPVQSNSPVPLPASTSIPQPTFTFNVPGSPYLNPNPKPPQNERQSYSWAGPQIKLPAEITDQLPETIVPSQSSQPTTFTPQAASTAPPSQPAFQPPKSVPIPDLAKLQSGEPSSNNLFATINGLQNRSTTTAPKTSGFYGGFY